MPQDLQEGQPLCIRRNRYVLGGQSHAGRLPDGCQAAASKKKQQQQEQQPSIVPEPEKSLGPSFVSLKDPVGNSLEWFPCQTFTLYIDNPDDPYAKGCEELEVDWEVAVRAFPDHVPKLGESEDSNGMNVVLEVSPRTLEFYISCFITKKRNALPTVGYCLKHMNRWGLAVEPLYYYKQFLINATI